MHLLNCDQIYNHFPNNSSLNFNRISRLDLSGISDFGNQLDHVRCKALYDSTVHHLQDPLIRNGVIDGFRKVLFDPQNSFTYCWILVKNFINSTHIGKSILYRTEGVLNGTQGLTHGMLNGDPGNFVELSIQMNCTRPTSNLTRKLPTTLLRWFPQSMHRMTTSKRGELKQSDQFAFRFINTTRTISPLVTGSLAYYKDKINEEHLKAAGLYNRLHLSEIEERGMDKRGWIDSNTTEAVKALEEAIKKIKEMIPTTTEEQLCPSLENSHNANCIGFSKKTGSSTDENSKYYPAHLQTIKQITIKQNKQYRRL